MSQRPNLSGFDPFAKGGGSDDASSSFNPAQQHGQHHGPVAQQPYVTAPTINLDDQQRLFLEHEGFSSGLIRAIACEKYTRPLKILVVDNSAAMNVRDSHRLGPNFENIPSSRWEELNESVAYHSQVAALFKLHTRIALLNDPKIGPQYFSVGDKDPVHEVQVVRQVMTQHQPWGPTLLTEELHKLRQYIISIAPTLAPSAPPIAIVLATQGVPTGGGLPFLEALRSFVGLPVNFVIRLCTDDERVFEFYNSLDAQINLPYDVLDDFFGESLEVFLRNPWLTYALPLHRFRELGYSNQLIDAMDERALSIQEVHDLCSFLFGVPLPNPNVSWENFMQSLAHCLSQEKVHFNPVTKKVGPWINLHQLNSLYGTQTPGIPTTMFQAHAPPPAWQQQNQYHQQHNFQQAPHPVSPRQNPSSYAQSQEKVPESPQRQNPFQTASGTHDDSISSSLTVTTAVTQWGTLPPVHTVPRPLPDLLESLHSLLPPSFGIQSHSYFEKWTPFSKYALSSGEQAVLKRAVRKTKFFLHPDKLPKDFDEKQQQLCRSIWDAVAAASENENI